MNIGEKLFAPRSGETAEQHRERTDLMRETFRAALNHTAGRELMSILAEVCPPYGPRFAKGRTVEEAAQYDGEAGLIALMLMHSGISNLHKSQQTTEAETTTSKKLK